MATAVLSIDIEARIAKLESGLKNATGAVNSFGKYAKASADEAANSYDKLSQAAAAVGGKLEKAANVGRGTFDGMSNSARKTSLQMQQVSYQLNDFFVQISSGQSPLIAFIQQGSQLSGTFGGIGAAFKGVTALITPMILGVGTAAAVVGTLGLAWYKGMQESQAFGKALLLTGNYAGLTEDRFNAMSKSIAASATVSMGEARAALMGFVNTGQFTGKSLTKMSEAAALFAVASGKSTDEVVKDFATMSGGVAKWATEHNKQLNLLDPAQLKYIRRLEEMGEADKAELVIAEAVIARFKNQAENLGYLEAAWGNLSRGAKRAWDAMLDIGRADTPTDKIEALQKRIAARLKPVAEGSDIQSISRPDFATGSAKEKAKANAEDERQLAIELAKKADADAAAKAASDKARGNKAIGEADTLFDKYKSQKIKQAEELAEIDAKYKRAVELNPQMDKAAASDLLKKHDAAVAEINSRNKVPKGAAILRDDPTKALLANQLKDLEHQAGEEREILSEKNRTLDLLYGEHLISIKDYYEGRKTAADVALNAQIADYDKEIAALEAYKAKSGKATEQAETQGKINDLIDKKRKLTAAAAYEGKVAVFKEEKAYRDLETQIESVDAALEKMRGKGQTEAGALAKFDKEYADLITKLKIGKDDVGQGKVNELRQRTGAQAQFNEALSVSSELYQKLGLEEERIALSRQIGAITELDALLLTGAARQQKLVQIKMEVQANERLAASYPDNEDFAIKAEQARFELEKLAATADVLGDKFRTLFADNVSGPLTDFIDGTKTAKEAFTSFAKSITHELNSMASKSIADMLFGKKGAIGGAIGGVGDWIGKLFGGGKAEAGAGAEGGGLAGVGNDLFSAFAGTGAAAPGASTGVMSTLLGSLAGGKKGDAPNNPMYVKSVDLLAMAGGAGLSSVIPGTSGGGGGGLIDAGIKIASSYFGSTGGATGATSFAGGADSVAAENFFSMFAEAAAGAATGGETTPGWFMAGEEGRELIRTKGGARVYNNRDTEKMLGASAQKPSETVVNHNYNITVAPPVGSDRRTALQWGESVGQQIRGSGRNS